MAPGRAKRKANIEIAAPEAEAAAALAEPLLEPLLLLATEPQITLTVTLVDISGNEVGTVANPAKVRIALCGFGLVIPQVGTYLITGFVGTATMALIGPTDYLYEGSQITIMLWGNDVINPLGTYYAITILDGDDNIVQSGAYQFTGTQTIDLSSAPQIVPTNSLAYEPCTGAYPGTVYKAPGVVVIAAYNGVALRPGIDYTLSAGGKQINLTFTTYDTDNISALCTIVIPSSLAPGASMLRYVVCTGAIPGTVYTAPGRVVTVYYNGTSQPTTMWSLDSTETIITLTFTTYAGDTIYALCF